MKRGDFQMASGASGRGFKNRSGATRSQPKAALSINWQQLFGRSLLLMFFAALVFAVLVSAREVRAVKVGEVIITGYTANIDSADSDIGASEPQLQALIQDQLDAGFWQLNLQQLKASFESHPWVRKAVIRRQWPNQLLVGIDEYVAVARWNEKYLLSATGDIFEPVNIIPFTYLPLFKVEDHAGSELEVIKKSVRWFNTFQKPLAKFDLSVIELTRIRGGDFTLLLSNGMQMELGADQVNHRFERFLALLDGPLADKKRRIEIVDLRYSNGVSIKWREIDSPLDDALELAQMDFD
jgi:cell division protein FtsQ